MSKPLIVSISHRLGKDEAVRRLKSGLGMRARITVICSQRRRRPGRGTICNSASARSARRRAARSMFLEDHVNLVVYLPWLLAQIAAAIQPLVRKEGTLLLEKK